MTNRTPCSLDLTVLAAMIAPAPRVQPTPAASTASRFSDAAFQPRIRDGAVLIASTLTL